MIRLGLLVALPLVAPQTPQAVSDTSAPRPQPVAVAAIPEQAATDAARLASLTARLPGDTVIARLARRLDTLRRDVDQEADALTNERLAGLYFDDVLDLERRFGERARRLAAWRQRVGALTAQLDAARDTVSRIAERWALTQRRPARDVPAPLQAQVRDVLGAAEAARERLRPPRDSLLRLQSEAARLETTIGRQLERLRAAQARARREMFSRDGPPLWGLLTTEGLDSATAGTPAAPPDKFAQAAEYLAAHPGRLWAHLTLFVVLAALFGLLGRQRDRWTTAEFAIHWPASLLGRPIAAAALLSIAFLQVLYPRAPQGVYGLAFLAVLPALVLLLRQLLIAPLRVPAFLLAALYALRVLADTFLTGALASRVVLLLLAAAGVVVFVWFAERVAGGQGGMWRVGRILAMAGAMLLAGAFLANGYGFITLASLLVSATLASALAALALVALVDVVVGAVLVVLMVTPVGALEVIQRHRPRVTRRVTTVVRVAGVVVWGTVALRQFRALEPTLGGMGRVLAAPIAVGSWNFTTGDVVIFLLAIVVAVVIARGLREVLRQDVLARMRLGRGVPDAVAGIAYYTLLALGFVFAAGAAGIDLSRLALIAGALGVGIGFGLQSIVANFISGLILLFERPVQSGDTVEFDGLKGVVQSIGMRASIVRTFQGADVIVPNQDFIVGRVVNWTLSDQTRRVEIPVGVAYGSDPARVIALLTETAARCRGVLPKPAPQVLFTAFGESSLDFEIRLWSAADTWLETQSAVLVAAYQALAEARIEIPFPQRDLHVRSVDGGVARSFGRTPS